MPLRCVSIRFLTRTHIYTYTHVDIAKCCAVVSIISIISFRADRVCKLNNRRSLPFYRVYGWPSTTMHTTLGTFSINLDVLRGWRKPASSRRFQSRNSQVSATLLFLHEPRGGGEYCLRSIKVICVQDG